MKRWEIALNELAEAAKGQPMHSDWVNTQLNIVKNFIRTTEMYLRELENDFDEVSKGSYGGSD
jgi:hypothetical protein